MNSQPPPGFDNGTLLEILTHAPVGMLRIDGSNQIDVVNPKAVNILASLGLDLTCADGLAALATLGESVLESLDAADPGNPTPVRQQRIAYRTQWGAALFLSVTIVRLGDQALLVSLSDVTEEAAKDQAARGLQQRFETVMKAARGILVVELDMIGRIIDWNPTLERMLGLSQQDAVGRHLGDFLLPDLAESIGPDGLLAAARLRDCVTFEAKVRGHHGRTWRGHGTITATLGDDGEPTCLMHMRDITRLFERARRLEKVAHNDQLTGLLNRRGFFELVEETVQSAREDDSPVCVLAMDLDHFKQINDTHGHDVGDEVLRRAAKALSRCVRPSDLLARSGGEEFWCLLPATGPIGAVRVAGRLREALADAAVTVGENTISVTASMGLASWPEGVSLEEVLRRADVALYQAKANGRDRVEVADDALDPSESATQEEAGALPVEEQWPVPLPPTPAVAGALRQEPEGR